MRLDCVVGLGSNVGDRRAILAGALRAIRERAVVVGVSALYETAPVGGPEQGDHLNAAVRLHFPGRAGELLAVLQTLENRFARDRQVHWGPRTLDLDLLWIEGVAIDSERLKVPHPRLLERAFALIPLLEVAPDAIDPRSGCRLSDAAGTARGAIHRRDVPESWWRF